MRHRAATPRAAVAAAGRARVHRRVPARAPRCPKARRRKRRRSSPRSRARRGALRPPIAPRLLRHPRPLRLLVPAPPTSPRPNSANACSIPRRAIRSSSTAGRNSSRRWTVATRKPSKDGARCSSGDARAELRNDAGEPRDASVMSPSRPFIQRPVATSLLMLAIVLAGLVGCRMLPLSALPADLPAPPVYAKVNPADAPVLSLAITSDTLPLTEVQNIANTRLALKISQVNGVGLVTLSGGQRPAVRIQVDTRALASYGLTLSDVRTAITSANANGAKGSIDGTTRSYTINANDQLVAAADYQSLVVA